MKILVLFKTHLDIGFTDLSENIVQKYMTKYIPDAISVGRQLCDAGRNEGFTWTTGSWLIWHYLKYADEAAIREMEQAVRDRLISWHGMPATMHSEVMNSTLFDYGLSLSQELDERFGRKTVAAKMTDVPGHTKAIVPHLSDAGIEFLHIGINPASCPAEVPFLFRWQFQGREIAVMYESSDYGGFRSIPGTDVSVCFAHTGDNLGPQSAAEIIRVYDDIHTRYPKAEVVAADLNDVAYEIRKIWDTLPVLTCEIGDTWIHGVGTDPQKVTSFRALLRVAEDFPPEQQKKLYERILIVPEHTWGLDEKLYLDENKNYTREHFDLRRNNYNFKMMELSWAEQRRYLTDGTEALDEPYREKAEQALTIYTQSVPEPCGTAIRKENINLGEWCLSVDEKGTVTRLAHRGEVLACGRLFGFSYDEYCAREVWDFEERYLRSEFWEPYRKNGVINWAINDFGKEGLCEEVTEHTSCEASLEKIILDGEELHIYVTLPRKACEKHGCPEMAVLTLLAEDDILRVDFLYHGKRANRAPEALWLNFCPDVRLIGISKLGYMINPFDVVSKGARELHATDGTVSFEGFDLITYDAPLLSIGGKHIYSFRNRLANPMNGVYINLFNNQWGTNFPMWAEGDHRFRFSIVAK